MGREQSREQQRKLKEKEEKIKRELEKSQQSEETREEANLRKKTGRENAWKVERQPKQLSKLALRERLNLGQKDKVTSNAKTIRKEKGER